MLEGVRIGLKIYTTEKRLRRATIGVIKQLWGNFFSKICICDWENKKKEIGFVQGYQSIFLEQQMWWFGKSVENVVVVPESAYLCVK